MSIKIASLNVYGLRNRGNSDKLLRDLLSFSVDVALNLSSIRHTGTDRLEIFLCQ